MRKTILAVAATLLLAVFATVQTGSAATHHRWSHPAATRPAPLHVVTPQSFEELVLDADHPVLILAVTANCPACTEAESALAREAPKFSGASFFVEDASELGLSAEHAPYLLVYVPAQGKTISVADFRPSRKKLHAYLALRIEFARREAAAGQAVANAESELYRQTAPFNARLDDLVVATIQELNTLADKETSIKNQKAATLAALTTQLLKMTQARQSAAGNLPAQATIDAQVEVLQKKMDDQTAGFDDQLAQIARDRVQAVQDFTAQRAAILADKDQTTKRLQNSLMQARQTLSAIIAADRQSAQAAQ